MIKKIIETYKIGKAIVSASNEIKNDATIEIIVSLGNIVPTLVMGPSRVSIADPISYSDDINSLCSLSCEGHKAG